jgi:xanthine dehydrogenase accessory factor
VLVIIKGAGDLASGIALRLRHAGFSIVMTEIASPMAVRRTVSFSEAVYKGRAAVEDITAVLARDEKEAQEILNAGNIAVLVDPPAHCIKRLSPACVIDAIMAKKNIGASISDAPVVIGVGPGFTAGEDCHAVIETQRGHSLGRVITKGSALPNTGVPGNIGGYTAERLLRAPVDGIFEACAEIGDMIKKGERAGFVRPSAAGNAAMAPVRAEIDGVLRGILPSGITVHSGMKVGDIDPRCAVSHCFTVSDKALAVAGGALEALLRFSPGK